MAQVVTAKLSAIIATSVGQSSIFQVYTEFLDATIATTIQDLILVLAITAGFD